MRTINCDKCGRKIEEKELHVLRLEEPDTDRRKQADFCPSCATHAFRSFDDPYPRAAREEEAA